MVATSPVWLRSAWHVAEADWGLLCMEKAHMLISKISLKKVKYLGNNFIFTACLYN